MEKNVKVLLIGSSKLPVPAVKGGAVPVLIEELINEQERKSAIDLYCCSLWDEKAERESLKYKNTKFIWAKIPKSVYSIDSIFTWVLKNIFKVNRLLSVGSLFQVIWFAIYIGKVLKNNEFDKIVFENSIPLLFSLKMYNNKKKYNNKYYIHIHSVPRKFYGNNNIFSNCTALITISRYVANEILQDNRIDISQEKIKLLYNCIDTNIIRPLSNNMVLQYRQKYNISNSDIILLFVGRLCKEKGIEEVIRLILKLADENIKLLIVGSNFYGSKIVSPYEQYLKSLAKPAKKSIIFTGYVDYKEIAYIYNMADIIILPSMWEEPAGMTIIEAMACKKPVITTMSGGIPEYVGEDNCIILKKDKNIVEAMADSVKKLLYDDIYSAELSERGYKQAVNYTSNVYYDEFVKILKEKNDE